MRTHGPFPRARLAASGLAAVLLGGLTGAQGHPAAGGGPGSGGKAPAGLARLAGTPAEVGFGAVPAGEERSVAVALENRGFLPLELRALRFLAATAGSSADFRVVIDGQSYAGEGTHTLVAPIALPRGGSHAATLVFTPTEERYDAFVLRFVTPDTSFDLSVSGLGGHDGHPFLHVEIAGPELVVDADGDGSELVTLDGTGSHTHEPGHALTSFTWRIDGAVVSTAPACTLSLGVPGATVELEIADDHVPPQTWSATHAVLVAPSGHVPGILACAHDASGLGATALLDGPLPPADRIERLATPHVPATSVLAAPEPVLLRLVAELALPAPDVYAFQLVGGGAAHLRVDGTLVAAPLFLAPGPHALELRVALETPAELPLDLSVTRVGSGALGPEVWTHDEGALAPALHALTPGGPAAGGVPVVLEGFGFTPAAAVVVHWGALALGLADLDRCTPERIELTLPPGTGAVPVAVETPAGTSPVRTFVHDGPTPPPVVFRAGPSLAVSAPTAAAWGPDGRLYVASLDGHVTVLTLDAAYGELVRTTCAGVSALANHDTLSLAFDPHDPPSPVRLYVGHGTLAQHGGLPPGGPSAYTGAVSRLVGPAFDAPEPVVTGLPVSNADHGVNGMVFDDNGDLLVSVGSLTNAGVGDPALGGLPESPLSAAVLKAALSRPGFQGAVTYVETLTGLPNDDQRSGEEVDVAAGVDVAVHAAGLRNAYGLVHTTAGRLYATDNGADVGLGPASTGPSTQGPDPDDGDTLELVEWGNYHGAPNRSRGRADPRQNVWYGGGTPSVPDVVRQRIGALPSSSDGLDEYRAATFAGQMRGELVVQKYQGRLWRVQLAPDGRSVLAQGTLEPNPRGLGCVTGPGGAILALDFDGDAVEVLLPDDRTPAALALDDLFPWRAPAAGGAPFVLAGHGFGSLASTAVTIGGRAAVLSEVTWNRIRGTLPPDPAPTTALQDVVVRVGADSVTLPAAFRALIGRGLEPGRWETLADVPLAVGEVAAAVLGGRMYLFGQGAFGATLVYDLEARQWLPSAAPRPFNGNHHAAEVLGSQLVLVGGIDGGSGGRLQIYDPATDAWTVGADLPWSGGSVATAVIDGKLYAAGGITAGGFTVSNCAAWDPATGAWSPRASMPDGGRNHTAAGTDGARLFVFGGRQGGNTTTNGFDSVMVYDPATDLWTWSGAPGSGLAPLPEARGGMGKAVFLRGELYVLGGETLDDPDATPERVYERVDVFDPVRGTWRAEAPLPHGRHGIHPVLYQGRIFVAGGGLREGFGQSSVFEVFRRP